MQLFDLDLALTKLLKPGDFHDFCPNGLIVDSTGHTGHPVFKVVTGVSLRDQLIDEAVRRDADAIIVHHPNGFWFSEKDKRVVYDNGKYLRKLISKKIDLFGYHLPLDAHPTVGNNVSICDALGLECDPCQAPFMDGIGRIGEGSLDKLSEAFPHGYQVYGNPIEPGRQYIVGVCSGSGTSGLEEAMNIGCSVFITGEVRESTPIFAEEHDMTVIAAGHHRSEVFGVRNLAKWLTDNHVPAEFVDIDNPV